MYQTFTTTHGLILYMYGPDMGMHQDMTLQRQIKLDTVLNNNLAIDAWKYILYRAPAYILKPWLLVGFGTALETDDKVSHNQCFSFVRRAVEWPHKDLKNMWRCKDLKPMLEDRK